MKLEIEHRYGDNVHILNDPFLLTKLASLCSKETAQPVINQLVETLYSNLIRTVMNQEFPKKRTRVPTRMVDAHPQEGIFEGDLLDREQKTVCVNIARAGTVPSHVCYNTLNYILFPSVVRQDHVYINRATNDKEEVIGTNLSGHKIGGPIDEAIVLIPDPMGATGSTIVSALEIYKKKIDGKAKKFVALHLIVTPEYLKNVFNSHPDLVVYAIRLDRGLSSPKVLSSVPGTYWDEEKGLNSKQYIVPGGGGFGEILNNAFI